MSLHIHNCKDIDFNCTDMSYKEHIMLKEYITAGIGIVSSHCTAMYD